jgi:hypothetical protein
MGLLLWNRPNLYAEKHVLADYEWRPVNLANMNAEIFLKML